MQSILKKPVTRTCCSHENNKRDSVSGESDTTQIKIEPGTLNQTQEDENTCNSDKGRAPNFTTAELNLLLDLVGNDYHFAHGNWDKVVDSDTAPSTGQSLLRERWMDITSQINAVAGYEREWREVKRKLTTWMSKVKKKAADIHAYNVLSLGNNDGLQLPPRLSNLDLRVFALVNNDQVDAATMLHMDPADSGMSCELAGNERLASEASPTDPTIDGVGTSDDSRWSSQHSEHISRLTGDADVSLYEINKSVKTLVEIDERRLKLKEKKLRMVEELVQTQRELVETQKELNANILKLIQRSA